MATPYFNPMGPIWETCGERNITIPLVACIGATGAKYEKANMAMQHCLNGCYMSKTWETEYENTTYRSHVVHIVAARKRQYGAATVT